LGRRMMKVFLQKSGSQTPGVDHELIWGAIGLMVLAAIRIVPPSLTNVYECPFHFMTGIPCLTCGMTRSFRHMVYGRLSEAFSLNPLGAFFCFFTILYVVYAFTVISLRLPRPRLQIDSSGGRLALRLALPVVLLMNWVYLYCHGV
jgi:hypothetical protein